MLEKSGLQVGQDFFLCFSPERVDPGNPKYQTVNIPKVVGGVTPACTEVATLFYSQALETVVPVSSTQVAEMVKLLENTFRMINIGLVNEMAVMCEHLGVDVWEVIEAAATKPFGFMKFLPGPGLGGHCIPIDPFYLTWKAKEVDYQTKFIELAGEINTDNRHTRHVWRLDSLAGSSAGSRATDAMDGAYGAHQHLRHHAVVRGAGHCALTCQSGTTPRQRRCKK